MRKSSGPARLNARSRRTSGISPSSAAFIPLQAGSVQQLLQSAARLRDEVSRLRFAPPVSFVYNPLEYAWEPHALYWTRYGGGCKRVLLLGMNPGPFGMVQTGVPFGEVAAVRDWLRIEAPVGHPERMHPRRLVTGFHCHRSEVSGHRLWGLFATRFGSAERFFKEHIVVNYCPLAFLEESGRNRTPDKLPASERIPLFRACDRHLRTAAEILDPEWVIGIGDFAAQRAREVFANSPVKAGQVLHPSPACPAANRDWAGQVTAQLKALGVWR